MTAEVPHRIRDREGLQPVEGGWVYWSAHRWWAWPVGGTYPWGPYLDTWAAERQLKTATRRKGGGS